jgi:hypothetical protein
MKTVSEEICGEYLKEVLQCDFVEYNIRTTITQGEIDVVGVRLSDKTVYLCEVAAHINGLGYSKSGKPDDYERFEKKFQRSLQYAKDKLADFNNINLMIWSPIVKISGEKANYCVYKELQRLKKDIYKETNISIDLVINEHFESKLNELRLIASKQTTNFSSRTMRYFQIEEYLKKHLISYRKKGKIE